MFSLSIRDHVMIAHSLPDPVFGPAQGLHGATYVVDASFETTELDRCNLVIDIGVAQSLLKQVLEPLAYKNLDELAQFEGQITTAEYLAQYIAKTQAGVWGVA